MTRSKGYLKLGPVFVFENSFSGVPCFKTVGVTSLFQGSRPETGTKKNACSRLDGIKCQDWRGPRHVLPLVGEEAVDRHFTRLARFRGTAKNTPRDELYTRYAAAAAGPSQYLQSPPFRAVSPKASVAGCKRGRALTTVCSFFAWTGCRRRKALPPQAAKRIKMRSR